MGLARRLRAARGASLSEYALLLFAVLIVGALGFKALGREVKQNADDARAVLEGDDPARNGSGGPGSGGPGGTAPNGGPGIAQGGGGSGAPSSVDPSGLTNATSGGGSGSSDRSSDAQGSNGGTFGTTVAGSSDPSGTPTSFGDSRNTIGTTGTVGGGTPEGATNQGLANNTVSANDGSEKAKPKGWAERTKDVALMGAQVAVSMVPGTATAEALYDLYKGEQTVGGVLKTAAEEVLDKTAGRAVAVYHTGEAVYDYARGEGTLGNVAINAVGMVGGGKATDAAKRIANKGEDAAKAGRKVNIPEHIGEKADDGFGGGVAGTTKKQNEAAETATGRAARSPNERAGDAFESAKASPPPPCKNGKGGCDERADHWGDVLEKEGYEVRQISVHTTGERNVVSGGKKDEAWNFHTAPTVKIEGKDYVIDPAWFPNGPATPQEWAKKMGGSPVITDRWKEGNKLPWPIENEVPYKYPGASTSMGVATSRTPVKDGLDQLTNTAVKKVGAQIGAQVGKEISAPREDEKTDKK